MSQGLYQIGGRSSPIRKSAVVASANGNATVVAAVPGMKIRVLSMVLVIKSAATDMTLQSGAGGTALLPAFNAVGTHVLPHNDGGWCEAAAGALLNLASTNTNGSIEVTYAEIPPGIDSP